MQKKRNLDRIGKVLADAEVLSGELRTASLIDVPKGVVLNEVGAGFPEDMSEEDWVEFGRRIYAAQRRSVWILIDWLKFGAGKWGDRYTTLAIQTGYSEGSLSNMLSVERRLSVRKEGLDFGHHASVAVLPPAKQRSVLDKAAKENWTVQQTRKHVATVKGDADSGAEPTPTLAHPEIKKLNQAMAYIGRIRQDELMRMNPGERDVVEQIVDQLSSELRSIAKHLKE